MPELKKLSDLMASEEYKNLNKQISDLRREIEARDRDLRVAIEKELLKLIAKMMLKQSLFIYSNPSDIAVSSAVVQPIYIGVPISQSTHLFMHLIFSGTASVANILTVEAVFDNQVFPLTLKHTLTVGYNIVDIPLILPQVPGGGHYLGINFKVDTGTFTILKNNLQFGLYGYYLEGGLSEEPPHAESGEVIYYVDVNVGDVVGTVIEATADTPIGSSAVGSQSFVNVVGNKAITGTSISIELI